MRLYLIRHGESEANVKRVYSGWCQVDLTPKGIEDAKDAQKRLTGIRFDKVYTSDLIRAKKTAELALPGYVYEETPLLRELNVGELAGKPGGTVPIQNFDFTPYGGENREMVRERLQEFLKKLESENLQTVAAFSHAGCLREMVDFILGVKIPNKSLLCQNCTVVILEYDGEDWKMHSWINP